MSKKVLAFLISLVRVVPMSERERESEGKDKWAKEGIHEDGREVGSSWEREAVEKTEGQKPGRVLLSFLPSGSLFF